MPEVKGGAVLQPHDPAGPVEPGKASSLHHSVLGAQRGYKVGASTKCTLGVLSMIKPDCAVREDKYISNRTNYERNSEEFVFFSEGRRTMIFANRGDSGAIVWDPLGRPLGLLFTGKQPHECDTRYSLVTPIKDVFDDIKTFSRGVIEEVQILGAREE